MMILTAVAKVTGKHKLMTASLVECCYAW